MSEKFEQQAKHLLDEVQLEPRAEVWQQVRSAIQPQKKRRRFIFWWLLPVGLAAGSLYYFTVQPTNNKPDTSVATHTTTASTDQSTKETIPSTKNNADDNDATVSVPANKPSEAPVTNNTPVFTTEKNNAIPSKTIVTVTSAQQQRKVSSRSNKNSYAKQEGTPVTLQSVPPSTDVIASEKKTTVPQTSTPVVSISADVTKSSVETSTVIASADTAAKKIPVANIAAMPSPKQSVDSQATAAAAPVLVTPNKARPKWSWGITGDVGFTTASTAALSLFGEKSLNDVFFSGGSLASSPSAAPSSLYKRVTATSGISLGLYATVNRQLGKTFAFQAAAGYRYQSFAVNVSTIKDSLQAGITFSMPLNMAAYEYRFHSLNIYTGMQMKVFGVNGFNVGMGAGIDHQLMLMANTITRNDVYTTPASSASTNNNSLALYRQWQPLLRLQLTADFNINQRKWLQLSPYYNYGLRTYEKKASSSKDHLSGFGLSATFFLK